MQGEAILFPHRTFCLLWISSLSKLHSDKVLTWDVIKIKLLLRKLWSLHGGTKGRWIHPLQCSLNAMWLKDTFLHFRSVKRSTWTSVRSWDIAVQMGKSSSSIMIRLILSPVLHFGPIIQHEPPFKFGCLSRILLYLCSMLALIWWNSTSLLFCCC